MPNTPTPISHPSQDYSITLIQHSDGTYRVTYGLQSKVFSTWKEASNDLGSCLFHSLECAGLVDRGELSTVGA